nr:MAG TPA: hypothetical protein [Caudoviricetes sp.]
MCYTVLKHKAVDVTLVGRSTAIFLLQIIDKFSHQ